MSQLPYNTPVSSSPGQAPGDLFSSAPSPVPPLTPGKFWEQLDGKGKYKNEPLSPTPGPAPGHGSNGAFDTGPSNTPNTGGTQFDQSGCASEGGESGSGPETVSVNPDALTQEKHQRRIKSLYGYRPRTHNVVREHQYEGVMLILQSLLSREGPRGCLLSQIMGSGKTMQVIIALAIIANASKSNSPDTLLIPNCLRKSRTLILCPSSLVENWSKEFEKWAPSKKCRSLGTVRCIVQRSKAKARMAHILDWERSEGVLIMSYEMLRQVIRYPARTSPDEHARVKDCLIKKTNIVVADEVHYLANHSSARAELCSKFETRARVGLSGTPMANHLTEYYHTINWAVPGCLQNLKEFKKTYLIGFKGNKPPKSGTKEARAFAKRLADLREVLSRHVHRVGMDVLSQNLPSKREFVLTIPLTKLQMTAYQICTESAMDTNDSFFARFARLSLICGHPAALLDELTRSEGELAISSEDGRLLNLLRQVSDVNSVTHSYRANVVDQIIEKSIELGDKVLIFSQRIATLNFLERFLTGRSRKYCRLDGNTSMSKRLSAIDAFNDSRSDGADVYLISTRAGGVGLNITGANRVIIYDSEFSPVHEEQAIGRVYRIGQKKEVFVYRLIAGGTFESKVYNGATRKSRVTSQVLDGETNRRASLVSLADYTSSPEVVELQDLSAFQGMDQVLDRILCSGLIADIHMY